jgi:hypothetical protein
LREPPDPELLLDRRQTIVRITAEALISPTRQARQIDRKKALLTGLTGAKKPQAAGASVSLTPIRTRTGSTQ